MSEKIKNYGKIRYIEPNDILEEQLYGDNDTSFNLTHPYENYSISVDLIVNRYKRFGSAVDGNNNEYRLDSIDSESISFLSGKDDYLSDGPGTLIYRDIMNSDIDGSRESLGINSINITYNSYYIPEVTINFTDIRGNGLMMVQEENYRRDAMKNNNSVESFFSSLFSFPYPEFKLRVKGFYGKEVEYSLLLQEFKSNFNNDTGNFECIVKFIGKMYGMYNDIPMIYLFAAPFCKYGANSNDTIWNKNDFRFEDGGKVPTFIDLYKTIKNINENIKGELSQYEIDIAKKNEKTKNDLLSIKSCYKSVIENIKDIRDSNDIFISSDDKFTLVTYYKNNYFYNNKFNYLDNDPSLSKCRTSLLELSNLIDNYNKCNDKKINHLFQYSTENTSFKVTENDCYDIIISNDTCIFKDNNNHEFPIEKGYFNEVTNFLYKNGYLTDKPLSPLPPFNTSSKKPVEDTQYYFNSYIPDINIYKKFVYLDNEKFIKDIDSIIKEKETDLDTINKKIDTNINTILSKLLGFKPNIKNIFLILMAHLQTFIEIYKSFIENVTGLNERKLNEYGLSLNQTDIKIKNNQTNISLPAFTSVKNLTTNTYCYPKKPIVSKTLEEVNLIESFFNGIFDISNKMEELIESPDKIEKIPTCLTDLYNDINPYNISINENSEYFGVDWIYTIFGIRFIQKYFFEKSNFNYDEFGKCEAYNFWVKNKNIDKYTKNILESHFCNGLNMCNYLTNEKIDFINPNKKPIYSNLTNSNGLLNIQNNRVKINDTINFPAVLGRLDNNNIWNTYVSDKDEKNIGIYSFDNEEGKYSRPYKYIRFLDENYLKKWETSMDNFGNDGYCDEVNWNGLVKNYIKSNVDFTENNNYRNEVFYTNGYNSTINFFTRITKKDTYKEIYNLKNIKQYYESNFEDYKLSNIVYYNKHIFFDKNLSPEHFLLTNIDLDKLAKKIYDGNTIITIPYTTLLLIGAVMYHLKNDDDNEFKNYLENNSLTSSEIGFIINCFTRNKENNFEKIFDINTQHNNSFGGSDYDTLFVKYKKIKDGGFLENDFLNLIGLYENWVSSKEKMGFEYFSEKYRLKVKDGENKSINDILTDYFEEIKDDNPDYNGIKQFLNNNFIPLTGKTNENETSFTDRYSKICYVRKNNLKVQVCFNEDFEAYQSLSDFFRLTTKLVLPYPMHDKEENNSYGGYEIKKITKYYDDINIVKDNLETSFNAFKAKLLELYNKNIKIDKEETSDINDDNKLSTYKVFKNLQDKYFFKLEDDREFRKYNMIKKGDNGTVEKNNEFSKFYFVDTFYNDLGDKLIVNLENIKNLIEMLIDGVVVSENGVKHNNMSVYTFMTKICENANMLFMNMPILDIFKKENIDENLSCMFTPLSYREGVRNRLEGPGFVCFYPNQPSQYLDNPSSEYENDGFDINNMGDSDNGPESIVDLKNGDNEKLIPAFGVEYGSQRQSIFKSIKVNMDNPQTTEASVANLFSLARGNNNDVRNLTFEGQDLYKIYSNYSYTCNVDMLGCAQIMPLMYFQLNNIPMFRGAYLIYRVEHNITPGDMITSFTGVRINRTKMPIADTCVSLKSLRTELLNGIDENKSNASIPLDITQIKQDNPISSDINKNDKNNVNLYKNMIGTEEWNVTSKLMKKTFPNTIEFAKDKKSDKAERFDMLNPVLRQIVYCIASEVSNINDTEGKQVLYISSATRLVSEVGEGHSDHTINSYGNDKRKSLTGKNYKGKTVSYNEMGCAVDMYIKKNGVKCEGKETQNLFKLIGENYFEYIRQLIWETTYTADVNTGKITNCVHLSSYGKDKGKNGFNDKRQIFIGSNDTNPKFSGNKIGSKNLPSEYLTIAQGIIDINGNDVDFTNFNDLKLRINGEIYG